MGIDLVSRVGADNERRFWKWCRYFRGSRGKFPNGGILAGGAREHSCVWVCVVIAFCLCVCSRACRVCGGQQNWEIRRWRFVADCLRGIQETVVVFLNSRPSWPDRPDCCLVSCAVIMFFSFFLSDVFAFSSFHHKNLLRKTHVFSLYTTAPPPPPPLLPFSRNAFAGMQGRVLFSPEKGIGPVRCWHSWFGWALIIGSG